MELKECLTHLENLSLSHIGFEYIAHDPSIVSRFLPGLEVKNDLIVIGRDTTRGVFVIWKDPEGMFPVIYLYSPEIFGAVCSRWQEFFRLIINGVLMVELALDDQYLIFSEYPGVEAIQKPLTPGQMHAFHQSQISRLRQKCFVEDIEDQKGFMHNRQRVTHHFEVWLKKNSK